MRIALGYGLLLEPSTVEAFKKFTEIIKYKVKKANLTWASGLRDDLVDC